MKKGGDAYGRVRKAAAAEEEEEKKKKKRLCISKRMYR